jgi:hypothetical protein
MEELPTAVTAQQAWLEKEIKRVTDVFHKDRERHKRGALSLRIAVVSLAGLTTCLLGWKNAPPDVAGFLPNLALVLSAAVTVFSAYDSFFAPRSLWIQETTTLARLRDLERLFQYQKAGAPRQQLSVETLHALKTQLDAILEESLRSWLRLRGSDAPPPHDPGSEPGGPSATG